MNYLPLLLGMVAVTYVPRMLPLTFLKNVKLPRYIRRFLTVLPAAALGALIIPGVLSSIPDSPVIAIVAVCIAGGASLLRGGMIVGVIAGVVAAFFLLLL